MKPVLTLDERPHNRLFALLGLLGVVMLGVSFSINQGPPPGANTAMLHAFAAANFRSVMLAGWLQVAGPALLAAFVFGVLTWLPVRTSWLVLATQFGMTVMMVVSLIEVVFYFAALYSTPDQMAELSLHLIGAVQHLYFDIAAPALFVPFGLALVRIRMPLLGWIAVALGCLFALVGLSTVFIQVLPNSVTILGALQALWWLAATSSIACLKSRPTA